MEDVFTTARFRVARVSDADELFKLNALFNGVDDCGGMSAEDIAKSLGNNPGELVCVAESGGGLTGFCCAQIFRSMCYTVDYAEITELFVLETSRRRGVGRGLVTFAESELRRLGINHFQLFTGKSNATARAFYRSSGYEPSTELMFRKRPPRAE